MIVLLKCEVPQGVQLTTLNISMKYGDIIECPKRVYDFNRELQNLCGMGHISARPKAPVSTPISAPPSSPSPTEPSAPSLDLDLLANKLLEKLSGVLSVDAIATAVAQKLPQGGVAGSNMARPQISEEPLTFIPSQILTEDTKVSSQPLEDFVLEDDGMEETLKALRKALRKG
jgi:hypothetical protein